MCYSTNSTMYSTITKWVNYLFIEYLRKVYFPGKKKIHNKELQSSMRKEMRRIMTATSEEFFFNYWNDYLKLLQDNNENEFIKYLQRYYFSDKNRMSWAYCYRYLF